MFGYLHRVDIRVLGWGAVGLLALIFALVVLFPQQSRAGNERVITIYYDDIEQTVVTDAPTVEEVLKRAKIPLGSLDAVEPARDTKLEAPAYNINIYRARPVTVVDGARSYTVVTPHSSALKITEAAKLPLYDEDTTELTRITDFLGENGVGLKLTITRATPFILVLYGKQQDVRTQKATVGEFMQEKGIVLGEQDGVNIPLDTPISAGLKLDIWRNGVQTITSEEDVAFTTEIIRAVDKPAGYREVKEAGKKGKKLVTYEIELRNGKEISRKQIQSVTTQQPTKQVEIVGGKSSGALTKAKGVNNFIDSRGISHRETYYDLPMSGVMRFCGGTYSVREDGAKVDQDGYVLVAANLNRYPRCSVVETSLGLGKVYDTGGFALVHPEGFDLATDWTNYDGR